MRECPSAESTQGENYQFAAFDCAVGACELRGRGIGKREDRAYGHVAVAQRLIEWVGEPGDQLHAKRETALVDETADPVEVMIVSLAGHGAGEAPGHGLGFWAKRAARLVDKLVELLRPPRQHNGKWRRVRKDQGEQ